MARENCLIDIDENLKCRKECGIPAKMSTCGEIYFEKSEVNLMFSGQKPCTRKIKQYHILFYILQGL